MQLLRAMTCHFPFVRRRVYALSCQQATVVVNGCRKQSIKLIDLWPTFKKVFKWGQSRLRMVKAKVTK